MLHLLIAILAFTLCACAQTSSLSLNHDVPEVNVALNLNGPGHYPIVSATYTSATSNPYNIIDGVLCSAPGNIWTTLNSPNPNDTLTITLPRPHNLTSVSLWIHQDVNNHIACPAAITITNGAGDILADIPSFAAECLANERNSVPLSTSGCEETDTLNINLTPQTNRAVGVCNVEIHAPANAGPFYPAADALLTDAEIRHDENSHITPNGAVVAMLSPDSEIEWTSIWSASGGTVGLRVDYKNNGTAAPVPKLQVRVNGDRVGKARLQKTIGAGYGGVVVTGVELGEGWNGVTVRGGGEGVFVDGIGVL